jgi:hypothetical protein
MPSREFEGSASGSSFAGFTQIFPERASREKTEFEFDYRIVHPGGEIRDIHTVGQPKLPV